MVSSSVNRNNTGYSALVPLAGDQDVLDPTAPVKKKVESASASHQ
jgi:hypothetical protein